MNNDVLRFRLPQTMTALLWGLLCFLYLNFFGPFTLGMPQTGLEASWTYCLNQAVGLGMAFGRDIIFTYGPYSAVFTRAYHPDTAFATMLGTLALNVIYVACFAWLARGARWSRWMILVCILVVPVFPMDAYIFSIPLLLLFSAYKLLTCCDVQIINRKSTWLCIVLLSACLGFLPLIKGTLILMAAGVCLFCAVLFCANRRWGGALAVLLCPVVSMLLLWMMAGQHLSDLPSFFGTMRYIVSGYSEAMAFSGRWWELPLFLIAAAVILHAVAAAKGLLPKRKIFLFLFCSFYLLLVFKAGYVRQDAHVSLALLGAAIAGLFLSLLNGENGVRFGAKRFLALSLMMTAYALPIVWEGNFNDLVKKGGGSLRQYKTQSMRANIASLTQTYGRQKLCTMAVASLPLYHLRAWRFGNAALQRDFEEARRQIRQQAALSFTINGNVDLYSYEQSALFANGYAWNPRPVMQSYSAYTPELITMNERHLRNAAAPNNIIFRLETIDDRFPSLDDGMSWPAMLDNYTVAGYANNWGHLVRKNAPLRNASHFRMLQTSSARLGVELPLPSATGPVFVTLQTAPSIAGKLLMQLYKIPSLNLTVTKDNGERSVYRVNSNMMQTGFFLSPLVASNEDFLRLFDPNASWREDQKIKSIVLNVDGGGTAFWRNSYGVSFQQYLY
jgi:hypothetical protein